MTSTTSVVVADERNQLLDDGLYEFHCPRCGKTVTRYHPKIKALFQLKCPRTGFVKRLDGPCNWQDYVYFNSQPEDYA